MNYPTSLILASFCKMIHLMMKTIIIIKWVFQKYQKNKSWIEFLLAKWPIGNMSFITSWWTITMIPFKTSFVHRTRYDFSTIKMLHMNDLVLGLICSKILLKDWLSFGHFTKNEKIWNKRILLQSSKVTFINSICGLVWISWQSISPNMINTLFYTKTFPSSYLIEVWKMLWCVWRNSQQRAERQIRQFNVLYLVPKRMYNYVRFLQISNFICQIPSNW